jgi:membrane protein implicated in regulation of membrane protease activity
LLSAKVILKYAVLQLAQTAVVVGVLIVVRHFTSMPAWIIITILAVWILKDIVFFPKVWRAYAFDDNRPIRSLVGLEATVVFTLNPVGHVRVKGEFWKAELRNPNSVAERGDRVRVVDVRGTTPIVESFDDR